MNPAAYGLDAQEAESDGLARTRHWVSKVLLTGFRNYPSMSLTVDERPVVLTGHNGAGKTNLLEAVSLLSPGTGLRRASFSEIKHIKSNSWAVSAQIHAAFSDHQIGTGSNPNASSERAGRVVRVDGKPVANAALSDYLNVSWLTPSMDGLFTGPASDRRRFLDRLIGCFDPGYQKRINHFERAMRQRNKLLESDADDIVFKGLELQMAEIGVSIAASRMEVLKQLSGIMLLRRDRNSGAFPWSNLSLDGKLENWLCEYAAVEVEDMYCQTLAHGRMTDKAAKRTLVGPHRTDFCVQHGPKELPAHYCSTGEQKALLVGLILGHAELIKNLNAGVAPIVLLDEIAAHFDQERRESLYSEILDLGVQAWMTGTDCAMFSYLTQKAQFFTVENGKVVC